MDEAAYFDFVKSKAADDESFAQEYMCVPSDDASAFISYELIDGCKYAPTIDWETIGQGELYLGVDIGRVKDLTVFWLLERVSGINFTRRCIRMQNATFDAQEAEFYRLMDLPRLRRACIDQTGIGRQFAERAAKRYGFRAEGVTFTAPVKESLAYPLRAAMEDRTLKIPDDDKITAAFRAIRKETTAAGNIRFVAESTDAGHADEFWAAALALHAGANSGVPTLPVAFANNRTARAIAARRNREVLA
jgi:phage FluMu gp28-like protein